MPKATDPQILDMPTQTMAVVRTEGDPNATAQEAIGPLYGAVYTLKFDRKKKGLADFKVSGLRARWPNVLSAPKDKWIGIWGLPVPDGTRKVPQKNPDVEVKVEKWKYGKVAQILHLGPYSEEGPTIKRLHDFIAASGYEIAGDHEEEYLTRPTAKVPKTIIRYPVRKKRCAK
jgi:hypothetical protein